MTELDKIRKKHVQRYPAAPAGSQKNTCVECGQWWGPIGCDTAVVLAAYDSCYRMLLIERRQNGRTTGESSA